jgi:hypothetical protein
MTSPNICSGDSMMYHNTTGTNGNCSGPGGGGGGGGGGNGSSPNSTPPNINACSSTTPPLSSGQTSQSDGNGNELVRLRAADMWLVLLVKIDIHRPAHKLFMNICSFYLLPTFFPLSLTRSRSRQNTNQQQLVSCQNIATGNDVSSSCQKLLETQYKLL